MTRPSMDFVTIPTLHPPAGHAQARVAMVGSPILSFFCSHWRRLL